MVKRGVAGTKLSRAAIGGAFSERIDVQLEGEVVVVRDTSNPASPALRYDKDEWRVFVAGAKAGEFDV